MGQLIDDILSFSRAGRRDLVLTDVDMTALFRSIFEELQAASNARSTELELAELPRARGDKAALQQVVTNLLSNAIKFTRGREVARIRIQAVADDQKITYSVTDNGVGFDPQYQHKLFGVFQRLHGAEEFEGTGIGLAIVKRFVEKHGGVVSAESALGKGATFRFSIPVYPTRTAG
jgi:signal transduction histidine kinase